MKEYLHLYNASEEGLNKELMTRQNDKPLVEYLVNICKSLEIINNIEFLGYEYEEDESKIDISSYIIAKKRKQDKEDYSYKLLQDTRYGELTVSFRLTCKDGYENNFTKSILVPKADKDGYFTIRGKKYFLLYQLVDRSTYTTQTELTLKSLMPVTLSRHMLEFEDTKGDTYAAPAYVIKLFKKNIDIFNIYFAKMGVSQTLRYFSTNTIITLKEDLNDIDEDEYLYFKINSSLYVEVVKELFKKYVYVRSIVFMLITTCNNRVKLSSIDHRNIWIEKLGSLTTTSQYKTFEKGQTLLMFFERMVDITTMEILQLHDDNKKSVFSIVRWMIQSYGDLRKKSNLDLENKRLRLNEYIASILNAEFSKRINRIIKDSKTSLAEIKNLFKFPGDLLVQNLHASGLLRYDDAVNDSDFFTKLKYTIKGPNSVGGKNERNIEMSLRGIHSSHLGRLDINVCGNSDPGTSGVVTPYCKDIYGLQFSNEYEPEDFRYELESDIDDYFARKNPEAYVKTVYEDVDDYYNKVNNFKDIAKQFKIFDTYTIPEDVVLIQLNIDEDMIL